MRGARAVLFDLDGVLVDSYAVWHAVLDATALELGYPTLSAAQFAESWGQGIGEDVRKFFPHHTIDQVERAYDRLFPEQLGALRIADGVAALFDQLERCGLRSAVITQTPQGMARELVARAGARPELIVGGTDVARPKPAPDMVLLACRKLGVAAADAVVVGDSHFDRDAAAAAGCRFVGVGIPGELTVAAVGELRAWVEPVPPR